MDKDQKPSEQTKSFETGNKLWNALSLILLCFVTGFLGAWALLTSGVVQQNVTNDISANRQTIVSQEGEVVADVFNKVDPSTVTITTESAFREGAGSGIVISEDGYVLTNKHVVPRGTGDITVTMNDGTTYDNVAVVGRDPLNDIAFLKIDGAKDLKPAVLGDSSKIVPGQKVVAIGNALGLFRNSVSSGIISGLARPIAAQDSGGGTEQLENLLQTDAAINPGNSGGPLVNYSGEVIGINTAVSDGGQGIGFAIPINDAKGVIKSVLSKGRVERAYLGVRYININPENKEQLKVSVSQGALVQDGVSKPAVVPGSPAAKAGIKAGDIITAVNDQKVNESGLASLMSQYSPGDKVNLSILRGDKKIELKVTLETLNS